MSVETGFSGMVDHFGLASADLKLQSSSYVTRGKGTEHAEDDCGNTVEQGNYIEGAGTAVECVYHLQGGSGLNLNTLKLGPDTTTVIESINVDTSNSDWPVITATGYIIATGSATVNPQGKNFTLPSITIEPKRCAQLLGFTLTGAGAELQSSSLSASGETHYDLADADTVGVVAFTGAELTVGGEVLLKSATLTVSYTGTVVETTPPDLSGEITGWTTASFEGTGYIAPDA